MSTLSQPELLQLPSGESGPLLALGVGQPDVEWSLRSHDLTRGVLIAGGQGSGKSSLLYSLALHRAYAANTALMVFDMKGSLVERLLKMIPPNIPKRFYDHDAGQWREGHKRVWYLDLADAAFGVTPLEVREGWKVSELPDTFARIASLIVDALRDLFPDQLFQASQDIITRTVIGTMAIAWWEHVEHHRNAGTIPEEHGFSGSFEVLVRMLAPSDSTQIAAQRERQIPPNPWHVAAGRACQRVRGLDETAHQLLVEIPAAVNSNLQNMTQRMAAPANKLAPLVAQYASVRRFVGSRQRLSLQSVVESHDILIVNPRIEVLGEDAPEIITTFLLHMLNAQLNRQLRFPADTRPRLAVAIDEAHRLIGPTLVRMLATHREAGLTLLCALQYRAQIAATLESLAMQGLVHGGVSNLLQTVFVGRITDPNEAEVFAKSYRTVFDSLIRSGPQDQARIPVDASNLTTLPDFHFLGHAISGALDGKGTQALQAFTTTTIPMKEIHEIYNTWRNIHLKRMQAVFGAAEDRELAEFVRQPPPGLMGATQTARPARDSAVDDAADVARETVGREPERRPSRPHSGHRAEWQIDPDPTSDADVGLGERALIEDVGGARVHRAPPVAPPTQDRVVALLQFCMRPATQGPPDSEPEPFWPLVRDAAARAAAIESLRGLSAWTSEGDTQVAQAKKLAQVARESALIEGRAAGLSTASLQKATTRAAAQAKAAELRRYAGQAWHGSVTDLRISAGRTDLLDILARLPYSHDEILRPLLPQAVKPRTIPAALSDLREAGLVASANVKFDDGRGGRPVRLWTVTPRGRELLRSTRPDSARQPYLADDKPLPNQGQATTERGDVGHELCVQVVAAALLRYGATDVKCRWSTPEMIGGSLNITMVHEQSSAVTQHDLTPRGQTGLAIVGDSATVSGAITPDLRVQLDGTLAGDRRSVGMLLEIDRTRRPSYNEPKLVAYDHFLTGWCLRLRTPFGSDRHPVRPLVVFVSPDDKTARALATRADDVLGVGIGLPGHDVATYGYFGRTHVAFTTLDWILAGTPYAYRVPELPPSVRGRGLQSEPELVELLPRAWWPEAPTSAPRATRR